MSRRVEILAEGLDFGEGPRWHDGRLWVSDFWARRVLSFGSTGDRRVEVVIGEEETSQDVATF